MDKAEESALTEGGEVTMFLLTRLLSIASSNESVIQQILQAGVVLMFNGQPPGEAKSSVCGRTWGPGAMAYRCSDCQMNSSSCICVDCFKHGDHEGHDYRLYSSGYGGCCDCGDPAAWKPKGFCSKHSASSTESTAEQNFNPEATKVFLDHVLGLLHTRMVSYLKQEENVAGIGLILTFISKVCSFGDAPRRVMAEAMLSFGKADDILKAPDRPSVLEHHISDFTKLLKGRVTTGPASLLDVMVMACAEVRDQVHEQITKVFMDLNYDSGFKDEFAARFFYYYPAFIAYSYLPAKVSAVHVVLSTVTAQMLSFPGFVTRLAQEHGLFDMLLKCLTDFFDQFSTLTDGSDASQPSAGGGDGEPMETETETEAGNEATGSGEGTEAGSGRQDNIKRRQRKLINLTQRILRSEKSPWERVIGDLDMALDHRGTSALFIFGLPGTFTTWQHILAMLHGMNVNKRQVGHHVEYELDDWRTSFYLDMRLLDLIAALERDVALTVQAALTSEHKTSTGDEGEASVAMTEFEAGGVRWPQIHAVVRDQVRYLLDLVCSDGVEWQTTAFKALYYPPDAKHELRSIRWSPERDGVSFHIPLHRNLMAFVHSVASASATNTFLQDSVSVADLLGVHDKAGALLLLEHPLKCHLLLAQIDAGMWRRNGEHTMSGQSRWYRSSSLFGRGSRGDLLAIQCAVVLLGAEDFVATLVQRFGLLDFFELRRSVGESPAAAEASYDPQQASALAEGFFRLVLEVVTNRAMISSEHALRKQIIQWLAAGQQMTHSKLIKQITYEKIAKKEAEQILAEVAVFVRPQAGKQGYFQLKPEYWNEFDPYFLHFTQADLNLATENYHVAIKGKGLLPIATPSVPYAMFADVDDILRSPLVHSLIYTVLHHTATYAKSSKYSESVLDGALHLLMLCLRRETTDRADACARDVSVDVREDESNPCSALKHPAGDGSSSSADVSIAAGPFSLLDRLMLKVRSDDVGGNQGDEASSMLDLLIKLRKASEQQDRPLAEEKPFLDELLRVVRAMDDECAQVIDASFEDASRESKAKTARERARERIMAQMKRQQQAFIDKSQTQELKMDTEEAEGGEEEGGTRGEVAPSVYPGHPTAECVLCRETKPWDEQPLGLIGACKRSRLLSLANQQPVRLENWRRTFLEVIERQKAKDAGSKGKDKEVAEPLSPSDERPVAPPEPLGLHITVKELKELMELLRGFLEEIPLMVSVNRLEGFTDNPRLLDMLLDAYAREVQADNSQPITDDYVQRHAHEQHHEAVRSPASPSTAGPSSSSSSSSASAEPVSPLLYADFEQTSVLMQSCGHTIHFDCWKGYLEARATSRRNYGSHEDMLLSEIFQEFWCPQCRRLSNVLIPLVPSSIARPWPLQPATEPPLSQESYERWLFQFLGEEEDDYEFGQDYEAMFSSGEDEDEEWAADAGWDENESEGNEDAARMERLEGLLGLDTSSDSDLDDIPSLEDSSDSDLEPNEAAAAPGHAHPQEQQQQVQEMDDVDGHADGNGNGNGNGNGEEMNHDEHQQEESRIDDDGGAGDGREEEEEEEEGGGGGGGGGEYEFGEVEGGEGEEEELMADELSRAEALARGMRRAERAKMRALTSRFTRHIYAVKKYRHKPSPPLKHREQPLYLLANLSYSIAELELSIRGSGPVADHDQQSAPEEAEEQHSVMRRFTCLSERRYAHFKDVYELVKASLADQRYSNLRRWRRLVRATIRGSSHEVGAKPLLSTELFPLLVTWLSLEQAHAPSSPPAWNSVSDSDSDSPSPAWVSPFVHVALTAAVTQVMLSLLSYRPEPLTMASRRERSSTPESWEDDMEEEQREVPAEKPSDDDIASLLRYLRACVDVQGKNESESDSNSENEDENEAQDHEKPRRRGMEARLPSLDVLDGRGEGDRRVAAERVLASHGALVRFVKAHTVPLLRRTALFLATCHHLPLAGLLALEDERHGGQLGAKESEKAKNQDGDGLLSAEFDVLATFLGLPPLESLLFGGNLDPMWQLVQGWWRHQSAVDRLTSPPAAGSIPCIASPVPFKLIELPHLFQDVFLAYLDKKCSKCNTQPSKPAICLICGTLLCAEGECCKQTRCGECFRHAIMCGGGVGLFLLAKTSGVLLIAEDKSCLWGSPYFDQYGEEDVLLKRGANLFLDRSVYGHLNQLLVEHQLESEILRADVPPFKKAQPARKW